jgi:hypothetical protein
VTRKLFAVFHILAFVCLSAALLLLPQKTEAASQQGASSTVEHLTNH